MAADWVNLMENMNWVMGVFNLTSPLEKIGQEAQKLVASVFIFQASSGLGRGTGGFRHFNENRNEEEEDRVFPLVSKESTPKQRLCGFPVR